VFLVRFKTHLVKADVLGLLTEALTAQVEVVLADETGLVLAHAATYKLAHIARLNILSTLLAAPSGVRGVFWISHQTGGRGIWISYQAREPLP
jgi:hypothetical protein